MSESDKLTRREIDALEYTIAVAWEGKPKPKSTQLRDLIQEDIRRAMDKLRKGQIR